MEIDAEMNEFLLKALKYKFSCTKFRTEIKLIYWLTIQVVP